MSNETFEVSGVRFLLEMFDESEKWPFEVPPGHTKRNKEISIQLSWVVCLQRKNSACVIYSLWSVFYFIGDKIDTDFFKNEIIPSLKANDRLRFFLRCANE